VTVVWLRLIAVVHSVLAESVQQVVLFTWREDSSVWHLW
jgi:hypothetical protein